MVFFNVLFRCFVSNNDTCAVLNPFTDLNSRLASQCNFVILKFCNLFQSIKFFYVI